MKLMPTLTRYALRTFVLLGFLAAGAAWAQSQKPQVEIRTNLGTITMELYPDVAPDTMKNFLQYVSDGFYDGTIFHRVIDGFMIQGGGLTTDLLPKQTRAPILFENINRLPNKTGSVAMARSSDPNSGRSQFFINVVDNKSLDYRGQANHEIGYVVFGQVISGMNVVNAIQRTPVATVGGMQNVPTQAVVMEQVGLVGSSPRPSSPNVNQRDDPKVFGRSARGG